MDDVTRARKKKLTPEEEAREEIIAGLREKYPNGLHQLEPVAHNVFAVRPSRQAWKAYKGMMRQHPEAEDIASENFCRECIVHPDADAIGVLFEQYPAILETFLNQLVRLAGLDGDARAKKL